MEIWLAQERDESMCKPSDLKGGNPVKGASRRAKQWEICMIIISLVLVVFISMSFLSPGEKLC